MENLLIKYCATFPLCLLPALALAQAPDPFLIQEPELSDEFVESTQYPYVVNDWSTDGTTLTQEELDAIEEAFDRAATEPEPGGLDERANILISAIWPVRTIPVCWENATGNDEFRRIVEDAVTLTWQRYSALEFSNWGQCAVDTRGIRIRIADENPRALLGKRIDGVRNGMVLNATFVNYSPICQNPAYYETCVRGIAIHEFGHALGFAHEQNRSDTPDTCTKPAQGPDGTETFGLPWDDHSVMNYCNPVWWNQGGISRLDAYVLQKLYGEPGQ
jgi:hypothetical protein